MGQNRKQIAKNERDSNDFVLPPALTLFGGKGDDVLNEPLTKTEQIFYQALADYERDTDPKELYHILDLQRRKKVLVSEDLLPSVTCSGISGQGGALAPGAEN